MRQQTMNELFTRTSKWIRNFTCKVIKVAVSLVHARQLQSSCVTSNMFVVYLLSTHRRNNTVRTLLMKQRMSIKSVEKMSSVSTSTSATFLMEHAMKNFIKCC